MSVDLRATAVNYTYGSRAAALTDINLEFGAGVCGLLGLNGAGKSTLLSILSGARRPTSGSVTINGRSLFGRDRRRVLPRVALMPQDMQLPTHLTTLEYVTMIAWLRGAGSRNAASLARQALDVVNLHQKAAARLGTLSGGMQRRVHLAQALATSPQVLLLDEPTAGLDPEQRHAMLAILRSLADRGISTVVSSHLLADIIDIADRVALLHNGVIIFDDSLDALAAPAPGQPLSANAVEAAFLAKIASA